MKKIVLLISVVCLSLSLCISATALNAGKVSVTYDGVMLYENQNLLINGVTYVPFRNFFGNTAGLDIIWDGDSRTAIARTEGLDIYAQNGSEYILANGRYLYSANKNIIDNGTMYVPIRPAVKALGGSVEWYSPGKCAEVYSGDEYIEDADSFYDETDLYWLARIINAESAGQPLHGKIAVGNVVLNRVRSSSYPDTIYDVIFDTNFGVQFTPTMNGAIYNEPNEESVMAAKICLEGYSLNDEIMFFINAKTASSLWVSQNCIYVMKIGDHDFYM